MRALGETLLISALPFFDYPCQLFQAGTYKQSVYGPRISRVKVVAAATRIGANGVALSLGEAQEVGGGVRARAPVSAGAAVSALSGWAKRVVGSVSGRFTF